MSKFIMYLSLIIVILALTTCAPKADACPFLAETIGFKHLVQDKFATDKPENSSPPEGGLFPGASSPEFVGPESGSAIVIPIPTANPGTIWESLQALVLGWIVFAIRRRTGINLSVEPVAKDPSKV